MKLPSRLLAIGRGRYGVFTWDEATDSGMTPRMIRRRLSEGILVALHPNVFMQAGTVTNWRTHVAAACLWSQDGLASHRTAAALHGLPGFREEGRPEITVTSCHLPPRSGIRVHVTDRLPDCQRTTKHDLPITSAERTLLDLGAVCPEYRVAVAMDHALLRGLTTTDDLDECLRLTARRGRRGCGVMRRLLKRRIGLQTYPNTPAESILFDLLCQSPLPRPELQLEIDLPGGDVARPDFAWPGRRFAVEMDGFAFHWGRDAFERDRSRLNQLTLIGWTVIFGTWQEARANPDGLLHRIVAGYDAAA